MPALDGDATTLGLTAPASVQVSSKTLEKWEARARLGVMVSSHDNHFTVALALLLKEENISSLGANIILEAFDTGIKQASHGTESSDRHRDTDHEEGCSFNCS